MKLTKAQKRIIEDLKDGGVIQHDHRTSGGWWMMASYSPDNRWVRDTTIGPLLAAGILVATREEKRSEEYPYRITRLRTLVTYNRAKASE